MTNQKIRIPTKKELLAVYPGKNLVEAGKHFGVGQTLFHKWLKHHNIERVRKSREPRSKVHKENLSRSQKGRTRPHRRRGKTLNCPECEKEFYLRPSLINRSGKNYCSIDCRSRAHRNPITEKPCLHCGGLFERERNQTSQQWNLRKYCSEKCRVEAAPPPTFFGEDNPRFKGETARRRRREGPHRVWRQSVLARDNAQCQRCGETDGVLVAHHLLSWEDHPELRFDVDNGLTLCEPCHFEEHGYNLNKSGILETTDERGVLNRRWVGNCLNCEKTVVKRASDLKRQDGSIRTYAFCSRSCHAKLMQKLCDGKMNGKDVQSLLEKESSSKSVVRSTS
jgi:hypothetical protein